MGLYACRECQREVSDQAESCQYCGCPTSGKSLWKSLSELSTPITFVFLIIGLLILFVLINPEYFLKDSSSEKLSDLGSFLGGLLNPLLTFISVILLITTLKLTRDSVDISKRELSLSRQAMAESAVALKNQAQSLETQNFNSLFFNLLSFHEATVQALKVEYVDLQGMTIKANGEGCFEILYEEMSHDLNIAMMGNLPLFDGGAKVDFFNKGMSEFRKRNLANLDHCMLTIKTILSTVDSAAKHIKKDDYINILKSQLSKPELVMILYYGAHAGYGKESIFKQLLAKYDLFSHITIAPSSFEAIVKSFYQDNL